MSSWTWTRRAWSSLLFHSQTAQVYARPTTSSQFSRRAHSFNLPPRTQRTLSYLWSTRFFRLRYWRNFFTTTLKYYFILVLISEHTIEARPSKGPSMLPTLADGGEWNIKMTLPFYRLLSSLYSGHFFTKVWTPRQAPTTIGSISKKDPSDSIGLSVGDLAVYISPNDPSKEVCKRVIGLPGDTVLVDPRVESSPFHELEWGSKRENKGLEQRKATTFATGPTYIVVPKGHIWTSGDNLANSIDSRHYGPVPLGLVKGKLVARCLPLSSASLLRNPIYAAQ